MINEIPFIFIGQVPGAEAAKGVFDDFFGGISGSMAPMLGEFLPKLLGLSLIHI